MDGSSFLPTLPAAANAKPQKAFATAFAVMALALAGCASGLGVQAPEQSATGMVSRVEDGAIVASREAVLASAEAGHAYTVRLRTGELVSIAQAGDAVIANGTPVLVEYGAHARVIPQNISIGY
jgi:hypothetical protein